MAEGRPASQAALRIRVVERKPFRLCRRLGRFEGWRGHWLQSYAIVTTEANELMSRIHPRLPVILHSRDYDRWLNREETEQLPLDLLRPFESEAMEMREANPKVNNVRNTGPELLEKAEIAAESGQLPL